MSQAEEIAAAIQARAGGSGRVMVALAGPPAAGKSTISAALGGDIAGRDRRRSCRWTDSTMTTRCSGSWAVASEGRAGDLRLRRLGGFAHAASIRRRGSSDPYLRSQHGAFAGGGGDRRDGGSLCPGEGNYLLLDEEPWTELASVFDYTVFIDVPESELDRRWSSDGASTVASPKQRAAGSIRTTCRTSGACWRDAVRADLVVRGEAFAAGT
jgi:hypothetical protein